MRAEQAYTIQGGDYQNIGRVSNIVKKWLTGLKIDRRRVRRVVVSVFEVEANIILYARQGEIKVQVCDERVIVASNDEGPGIENVPLAMREGFTTANEKIRRLGFGAGMGLSNINKNADIVWIASEVNKGTTIRLVFF